MLGIKIYNGVVASTSNINQVGDSWVFQNGDPFIHVKFKKPITGFRVYICLNKPLNQEIYTAIYFKNRDEVFSEDKCFRYNVFLNTHCVDDIYFSRQVEEIRFDFTDENIIVDVKSIVFEPLLNNVHDNVLKENFNYNDGKDGILIVSHDLSHSGAPILAYNIARKLQEENTVTLLVCNSSKNELLVDYNKINIPIIFLDDLSKNTARRHYVLVNSADRLIEENYLESIISTAQQLGYNKVITNTIISTLYAKEFQKFDFLVVSLIHEMKMAIRLLNLDKNKSIGKFSDFLVFPDEIVFKEFKDIFNTINGKIIIRPQGVYLKAIGGSLDINELELKKYGLTRETRYIMGSGIANLCKGIDLFISAATILHGLDETLHFVWTGDFESDNDLKRWLFKQIENSNLANQIHIIPFIKDQNMYQTVLKQAEAFWLTSRGDSFPSVVLEAMNFHVPVIGFKDSGGINTIASENRGVLVENFDVNKLAVVTEKLINSDVYRIDEESISKFIKDLDFNNYMIFLMDLLRQRKEINTK